MPNWSNNIFIDSLLLGTKWGTNNIRYYLDNNISNPNLRWNSIETTSFTNALNSWSNVADINFTLGTRTNAQLIEELILGDGFILGEHEVYSNYTGSTINNIPANTSLYGSFSTLGNGWDKNDSKGGLSIGGDGFSTIVHEIGHALGLDHTHADDDTDPHAFPNVGLDSNSLGDNELNQNVYSVMSYASASFTNNSFENFGYGFLAGPMAFDIAAIQFLYGINDHFNNLDTSYILPDENTNGTYYTSIWDTGGTDEIVYNGNKNIEINLNSASLQNEVGGGGFVSRADNINGGFTIAADFTKALANQGLETGVIIENARGGNGDDTIKGNKANNQLEGGKGNDDLYGGGGVDTFIFNLDWGSDTIFDFDSNDKIDFSSIASINSLADLTINTNNNTTTITSDIGTISLPNANLSLQNNNFIFSHTDITTTPEELIAGLYIAAFDRAADKEGIDFWSSQANKAITSGASTDIIYKDQIMTGFVTNSVFFQHI